MGSVTVQDENGAPLPGALVWTNSNGVAVSTTQGSPGLYTLTIVNIVLSQYTFDPSHSVLTKSITVP